MTTSDQLAEISRDQSSPVSERVDRIAAELSQKSDRGVSAAVECLLETDDERVSSFAAQYLSLIQGARSEKSRAARRLRESRLPVVRSAAKLVPWLPPELLKDFINDYLMNPERGSPLSSVIFNISTYTPELLRPFADKITSPSVHRGLLSGAPDELVDAFLARWRDEESSFDTSLLERLALIRTDHARRAIYSVRSEVEDNHEWERLLALSGELYDRKQDAGYKPSFMGFVTDTNESQHVMGGSLQMPMPICQACSAAAERVLTVSADQKSFDLKNDASFFWYTCDCGVLDSITAHVSPDSVEVYHGPQGHSQFSRRNVPGRLSLTLEPHPNPAGISIKATAKQSRHQVGGLPHWIRPDAHPHCPKCRMSMPFLASIDSGPTPYGHLDFGGTLYCFWCDGCRVSTTQIQF